MDFYTHARLHGVEIDRLYPSDKIIRCGTTEHPKSKNGAYFYDGERGWVQAWDGDCEIHWWDDPNRPEPTEEQRRRWAAEKERREAERLRLFGAAALQAAEMEKTAVFKEANYLMYKGLHDQKGLVLPNGELFVPMYNLVKNTICGGQRIIWKPDELKYEKKYLFGSQPRGAVFAIGPKTAVEEVILCEGYATGLSIAKAAQGLNLRATVVVCFNDSNLAVIAADLTKATYLRLSGVVRAYTFADNDASGAGERAAKAAGIDYVMSPVVGEDANDLHVRAGIVEVQKLIMKARRLGSAAA